MQSELIEQVVRAPACLQEKQRCAASHLCLWLALTDTGIMVPNRPSWCRCFPGFIARLDRTKLGKLGVDTKVRCGFWQVPIGKGGAQDARVQDACLKSRLEKDAKLSTFWSSSLRSQTNTVLNVAQSQYVLRRRGSQLQLSLLRVDSCRSGPLSTCSGCPCPDSANF